MEKNLPARQETWVRDLGQEDLLEKGMATHSSILTWEIHGQWRLEGYSLSVLHMVMYICQCFSPILSFPR